MEVPGCLANSLPLHSGVTSALILSSSSAVNTLFIRFSKSVNWFFCLVFPHFHFIFRVCIPPGLQHNGPATGMSLIVIPGLRHSTLSTLPLPFHTRLLRHSVSYKRPSPVPFSPFLRDVSGFIWYFWLVDSCTCCSQANITGSFRWTPGSLMEKSLSLGPVQKLTATWLVPLSFAQRGTGQRSVSSYNPVGTKNAFSVHVCWSHLCPADTYLVCIIQPSFEVCTLGDNMPWPLFSYNIIILSRANTTPMAAVDQGMNGEIRSSFLVQFGRS